MDNPIDNYYNLTELQGKLLAIIAGKANYHPSIYARSSKGEFMHWQTLDARKVAIAISKSLENNEL